MLRALLVGMPVFLLCLVLQALIVAYCAKYYAAYRIAREHRGSILLDTAMLSAVMAITLVGNFVQMGVWAVLFLLLGEFADYSDALYHSAVNFSTLGYGDIVMSERRRLLGPLEASNGILMFAVSSAVMTAAVVDVIKDNLARKKAATPS